MKYYFILLALFLFTSCSKTKESSDYDHTVKFEVNCTPNGFDVKYTDKDGASQSVHDTTGSWSTTIIGYPGQFVYLWAKAKNDTAAISCKIFFKGKLLEQGVDTADYAEVTATGLLR